ncbi:MAG: hypothetical protein JSV23_11145 [Promethearchaeota archaeon]|nr:MAG: hypothetical protein JSV23_11145 [Candidatus Lokiarchaeota archaeon]
MAIVFVKPVEPENLHLTVKFIGNISENIALTGLMNGDW